MQASGSLLAHGTDRPAGSSSCSTSPQPPSARHSASSAGMEWASSS